MRSCVTWSGQHDYQPRYDEKHRKLEPAVANESYRYGAKDMRNLTVLRVYVCDVCRFCGDVIDRLDSEAVD